MAISPDRANNADDLTPMPMRQFITDRRPDEVLLGPRHFADKLIIETASWEGESKLIVSTMDSCLVRYRRSRYRDETHLGQSTLSATWKRLNESQTGLILKDAA